MAGAIIPAKHSGSFERWVAWRRLPRARLVIELDHNETCAIQDKGEALQSLISQQIDWLLEDRCPDD